MAAPTLQAEGALAIVTTGDLTPVIPAHQADDILVLTAFLWAPQTAGSMAFWSSEPSGWTNVHDAVRVNASNIDGRGDVWWKRAASGSETNPTVGRPTGADTGVDTAFAGRVYVIRGCITTGNPWDDTSFSNEPSGDWLTTANGNVTAVTVSGSERMVVWFLNRSDDYVTAPTMSGWTAGTAVESTTGTDASFASFRKDNVSASTTGDAITQEAPAAGGWWAFGASFKPPATAVTLDATVAGTGTVAADTVRSTLALNSSVAGTGSVTADTVRSTLAVNAAVTGTGAVSASLAGQLSLAADVAGQGAVAADVSKIKQVEAAVAGLGSLLADIVLGPVALQAAVAASGQVVPELIVAGAPAAPSDNPDPNVQFFHTTRG